MDMPTAHIILFDAVGTAQSSGTATLTAQGRVQYGTWLWGGEHVFRRPTALIRRILEDWVADGATRAYEGWDEKAETAFSITK